MQVESMKNHITNLYEILKQKDTAQGSGKYDITSSMEFDADNERQQIQNRSYVKGQQPEKVQDSRNKSRFANKNSKPAS